MSLRPAAVLPLIALLAVVTACDDGPLGPDVERVPSLLEDVERGPHVDATYQAPLITVAVTTYRSGCYGSGGNDVDVDGRARTITIRLYDRPLDDICFPEGEPVRRTVAFFPPASGTWTIRVVGARIGTPAVPVDPYEPVTVEVQVAVS